MFYQRKEFLTEKGVWNIDGRFQEQSLLQPLFMCHTWFLNFTFFNIDMIDIVHSIFLKLPRSLIVEPNEFSKMRPFQISFHENDEMFSLWALTHQIFYERCVQTCVVNWWKISKVKFNQTFQSPFFIVSNLIFVSIKEKSAFFQRNNYSGRFKMLLIFKDELK